MDKVTLLALTDLTEKEERCEVVSWTTVFEYLLCFRHCIQHLASLPQDNSRSQSYESLKSF